MASITSSKVVLTPKNYLAEAKMRTHYVVLDRPANKAGRDAGPTPVEYLLTAIGGCVAMTLRIYLDRKNWDLGEITITVFHKEVLTKTGIENTIVEEITFQNKVSELEKVKLLKVAAQCPVAKMIKEKTNLTSKII